MLTKAKSLISKWRQIKFSKFGSGKLSKLLNFTEFSNLNNSFWLNPITLANLFNVLIHFSSQYETINDSWTFTTLVFFSRSSKKTFEKNLFHKGIKERNSQISLKFCFLSFYSFLLFKPHSKVLKMLFKQVETLFAFKEFRLNSLKISASTSFSCAPFSPHFHRRSWNAIKTNESSRFWLYQSMLGFRLRNIFYF